jgi:hypothetical protein
MGDATVAGRGERKGPSLIAWMWLGPLAFLVHDAEEIATVAPWLRANRSALPAAAQPFADVTTRQFALGVAVLFVGYVAATAAGAYLLRRGRLPLPFLLVTAAFAANGLTHPVQALLFRGYTPGVVTALLVALPYGYGVARAFRRASLLSPSSLRWLLLAGVLLQVPLVVLALAAGRGGA